MQWTHAFTLIIPRAARIKSATLLHAVMSYVPPHLRNRAAGGGTPREATGRSASNPDGGSRFEGRDGRSSHDDFDGRSGSGGGSSRFSHSDANRAGGRFNASDGHGSGRYGHQDVRHMGGDRGGNYHDDRSGGGKGYGGGKGHDSHRRPKGAPLRFGSVGRHMDGALRDGEDVPGGTRVDADGMVYEMADGSVRYFQDRGRKYPFNAGPAALPLLRGLLHTNQRVFALNKAIVDATDNPTATLRHGETLYADKPTMKAHHGALGTWSDEEYAHPGLQAVYLRLKSFQRFTESWALYERAARRGLFNRYLDDQASTSTTLHVVSLGGGPGYELLAFEWFLQYWAAVGDRSPASPEAQAWLRSRRDLGLGDQEIVKQSAVAEQDAVGLTLVDVTDDAAAPSTAPEGLPAGGSTAALAATMETAAVTAALPHLRLASLDLQPTWEPYVLALPDAKSQAEYSFAQWNIKEAVDAVTRSGLPRIDLCLISNVLVYCTDEATADVLTSLLTTHKVHAILINERGAEQKMVDMLQRRGIVVVRLMDQVGGVRDDRQLLLLPPGSTPPEDAAKGTEQGDVTGAADAKEKAPAASSQDVRASSQDVRSGGATGPSSREGRQRAGLAVFPNVPYEEAKHRGD